MEMFRVIHTGGPAGKDLGCFFRQIFPQVSYPKASGSHYAYLHLSSSCSLRHRLRASGDKPFSIDALILSRNQGVSALSNNPGTSSSTHKYCTNPTLIFQIRWRIVFLLFPNFSFKAVTVGLQGQDRSQTALPVFHLMEYQPKARRMRIQQEHGMSFFFRL